jgi:hypothetical protein
MSVCDDCGYEAKNPQGLSAHRRYKHGETPVSGGSMSVAMERTVAELERIGRFEEVDAARVQSLRTMASALDSNPFNSQMWRELRESLNEIVRADDDADDDLAAALAQIAGAASMGDTETA